MKPLYVVETIAIPATCNYHDDHEADFTPRGNVCGEPGTHVVVWIDGRYSFACAEHEAEIRRECPEFIRLTAKIGSRYRKKA